MKEKTDIVVLDRFDYDELVQQAKMTKAEIEDKAKKIYLLRNEVPVCIKFDQWLNRKNFDAPITFERYGNKEKEVRGFLDAIEPRIAAWMNENMRKYSEEMKKNKETERDCIGLRKHVANLQESTKRLRMRFSILMGYAIVITIILIWLSLLLVSGLQSLLK